MRELTSGERDRLREQMADVLSQWSRVVDDASGASRAETAGTTVDEDARRREHLSRLAVGEQMRLLVGELMARSADDAVRYGAGYPELGEAVGVSRQAARKRWPALPVRARRRWAREWADAPDVPGHVSGAADAGLGNVNHYSQG